MNKGGIQINGTNRKRDARLETAVSNFNHSKKARGVMDGEDFERFQNRLNSVGGNKELYDTVFGLPGEFPAME